MYIDEGTINLLKTNKKNNDEDIRIGLEYVQK
jgi:hypothetical protein